jgi:hypothetical protein
MLLAQAQALRAAQAEARAREIAARVTTTPTPPPVRAEANLGAVEGARPLLDPAVVALAHARLAAERRRIAASREVVKKPGPGIWWRPTPSRAENDTKAQSPSNVVLTKTWDLSPVDPSSFDPTQPPLPVGRRSTSPRRRSRSSPGSPLAISWPELREPGAEIRP